MPTFYSQEKKDVTIYTDPNEAIHIMLGISFVSGIIYFTYSLLRKPPTSTTSFHPFLSLLYLTVLWVVVLSLIIFCMGSGVSLVVPLFSLYLCSLTLWPLSPWLPSLPPFLPLLLPSVLPLVGAWLGAIVVPLSHDPFQPWKVWPVPCILGASVANCGGCVATLLLMAGRRLLGDTRVGGMVKNNQRQGKEVYSSEHID
eukprot:GHVS01096673.1.p1 GENE.GHVS01096673.1~~GHVS01096673.1.p1  ORF type:complete len:229 (-),score=13.24 GHVS01096673.1:228-824(-)